MSPYRIPGAIDNYKEHQKNIFLDKLDHYFSEKNLEYIIICLQSILAIGYLFLSIFILIHFPTIKEIGLLPCIVITASDICLFAGGLFVAFITASEIKCVLSRKY